MRYLDPKNDLTFKRIFGEHPHLCMSLLNSLLPLEPDGQIVELEYLSPEMVPEIPLLKRTIVDVRCKDQKGRQFIVEMQMYWTESFKNRVVFNASKAYVKQLDSAKEYKLLQPVYALSLVNEDFEDNLPEYYHHYKIINTERPEKQIKGLEFVFVELPKFKAKNLKEKKLQVLWLKFLTEIEDGTSHIPQELFEEAMIKEAVHCLEFNSYSKEQLEHYDRYWDNIRSERSAYLDAEERGKTEGRLEGIEKGKQIGIVEGKQMGIVEGKQIGIVEGKQIGIVEGKQIGIVEGKQIGIVESLQKVALQAIKNGLPDDVIISLTGLTKEEIAKLRK